MRIPSSSATLDDLLDIGIIRLDPLANSLYMSR